VFEKRGLKKKFGPKREEVTGGGGREDYMVRGLMICTGSPNIIRVIKSRRMRWAGHVERMEKRRGGVHAGFWW